MQTLVYYCSYGPVLRVFGASTSEQCLLSSLCSPGPPSFRARVCSGRSARGAQSPRLRLPASSVRARGFRRCCLCHACVFVSWVLIRSPNLPGARLCSGRSARGAQSPRRRLRLPASSVLARGFRRCCLGRPWVLIRSQGMPGARLEWGSG